MPFVTSQRSSEQMAQGKDLFHLASSMMWLFKNICVIMHTEGLLIHLQCGATAVLKLHCQHLMDLLRILINL